MIIGLLDPWPGEYYDDRLIQQMVPNYIDQLRTVILLRSAQEALQDFRDEDVGFFLDTYIKWNAWARNSSQLYQLTWSAYVLNYGILYGVEKFYGIPLCMY